MRPADSCAASCRYRPPLGGASVCIPPDGEPHPGFAECVPDREAGVIAGDGEGGRRNPFELELRGAHLECCDQMPVLDIVAKGIETDLQLRREGGKQPPRCVNDTQFLKRRGVWPTGLPNCQSFERSDGTGQERGGAVVGYGGRREQQCVSACRRQCDCRQQDLPGPAEPPQPPPPQAVKAGCSGVRPLSELRASVRSSLVEQT